MLLKLLFLYRFQAFRQWPKIFTKISTDSGSIKHCWKRHFLWALFAQTRLRYTIVSWNGNSRARIFCRNCFILPFERNVAVVETLLRTNWMIADLSCRKYTCPTYMKWFVIDEKVFTIMYEILHTRWKFSGYICQSLVKKKLEMENFLGVIEFINKTHVLMTHLLLFIINNVLDIYFSWRLKFLILSKKDDGRA